MSRFAAAPSRTAIATACTAAAAAACCLLTACGSASAPVPSASGPAARPPASTRGPAVQKPYHGIGVTSLSFVSARRGFALASVACGPARCPALLGTSDGGQTWERLTAPTPALGQPYSTCADRRPCAGFIAFASASTGYAFSPALLITTDGGRHWLMLAKTGVSALAVSGQTVTRVDSGSPGCSGRPYHVQTATVGGTTWRDLPAPAIEMICPPSLYRQADQLILAGYGNAAGGVRATARIDRSADGGKTWAAGPDSCGGQDGYASALAIAPPATVVLLCQHQKSRADGTYGPAWIRVSADNGATFGPAEPVPHLAGSHPGEVLSYQLAATSGSILVLAGRNQDWRLLRTVNGGTSWTVPLHPDAFGNAILSGFQGERTAWVGRAGLLWTTHDGGQTWHVSHFTAG